MTREEILSTGLLADVESHLDVTWQDDATDQKYMQYIASGIQYLDRKAGDPLDYGPEGDGRTLLLEYVRYARDGATDVFETNYLHLLLAMQNDRRVSAYVEGVSLPGGQ